MTARQRALAGEGEGGPGEAGELEMLEFGSGRAGNKEKELTEEERLLKAQKRKEVETEKREKMKQKTMETLLKKKDSKATKQIKTSKNAKEDSPKICYVSNMSGISLSYPAGHSYPLAAAPPRAPPPATPCVVCSQNKRYNSSRTGQPVCSLACYKADLAASEVQCN